MKTTKEQKITVDEIKAALPSKIHSSITPEFADLLNAVHEDNEVYLEQFRRNFFTFTDVFTESRYSLDEYLNAVQFTTLILFGKSDIDAYAATFPERYVELERKGYSRTEMGAWVHGYKKTQLVAKLLEKSMVAPYIIYQNIYHKALLQAVELATNARSEMVKAKALDTILNQLKMPETVKAKLEIGIKQDQDLIAHLEKISNELGTRQQKAIALGTNTIQEIVQMKLIPEILED